MSATFLVDLKNASVSGVSVVPQTVTAATATSGSFVDTQLSDGVVSMIVLYGTLSDQTLTVTPKMQEAKEDPANLGSALTSDATDMVNGAGSATAGSTSGIAGGVVVVASNQHSKRFVRAVVTTAGTGTLSCPVSVLILSRRKIGGNNPGNQL